MKKETKKTIVEFKDVVRTYGERETLQYAVNHVNFTIEEGEFVVILGQSGAGKSTVLNMLGGIDQPTEGEVMIDGEKVSSMNDKQLSDFRADKIGFIFQFYNLLPNMTALENVQIAGQLCKNPIPADEVLCQVGLGERMQNFPAQLSGGEQQRVAIARALAKRPRLLLCDEPTGALDYQTGKQILALLQKQSRENGMTVVIITHNSALTAMADRVIRIKSGQAISNVVNEHPTPVEEIEW